MNLYIVDPNIIGPMYITLNSFNIFKPRDTIDNIVEIDIKYIDEVTPGYISMLTFGKFTHTYEYKNISYSIKYDESEILYYLIQTKQIIFEEIIYDICQHDAVNCLKVLLEQGINVHIHDTDILTPLHIACCYYSDRCVKLLLDNGANVNMQDIDGDTPLHLACIDGYDECVKLLLDNGAKTDIVNIGNLTALDYAKYPKDSACLKLLQDFKNE